MTDTILTVSAVVVGALVILLVLAVVKIVMEIAMEQEPVTLWTEADREAVALERRRELDALLHHPKGKAVPFSRRMH